MEPRVRIYLARSAAVGRGLDGFGGSPRGPAGPARSMVLYQACGCRGPHLDTPGLAGPLLRICEPAELGCFWLESTARFGAAAVAGSWPRGGCYRIEGAAGGCPARSAGPMPATGSDWWPGISCGRASRLAGRPAPWGSSRFRGGLIRIPRRHATKNLPPPRMANSVPAGQGHKDSVPDIFMPEIDLGAVAHRAIWGYGVDPPSVWNPSI
jgi:hypothetical protein